MGALTWSDKYGIAAALALFAMVLVNNAILMLVLSLVGIAGGLWVVRKGGARRVAYVGLAGFILAAVFAVVSLTGMA